MTETNNGQCKFRIYVDRPSFLVSKEAKRRKRPNEKFSPIGHTFFGLVDDKGNEKRVGLYANAYAFGQENVPPEDVIRIPFDLFKKVSCSVLDDSHRRYDDVLEYKITPKQYEKAISIVDDAKKNPPRFCVVTNNCTTFACKVAQKIGLKPPYSLIGIKIPHTYSISIRATNRFNKLKEDISQAGQKLLAFFGVKDISIKTALGKEKDKSNISIIMQNKQR